jgi:hypothetical protein
MSTSTLVLNYIGWALLSIVVAVPSILIPWRLDRHSRKNTQAQSRVSLRGTTAARTPVAAASAAVDLRAPASSVPGHRARPQTSPR